MVKAKKEAIPCGEHQSIGWHCNKGHLCPVCKCNLKIEEALRVQAKEIFKEFRRIANENYDKDEGLVCDVFTLIDEVECFLGEEK